MDKVDEIVRQQQQQIHISPIKKEEADLRILQLYFDICFIVLVLRGTASSLQQQVFATVDVLRKDFIRKVETSIDVLTWSVTKSNINASIKSVVDESNCVSSVLPSSSSTAKSTPAAAVAAAAAIPKTSALKMSVETACDRLPLLPLVALAPAATAANNLMNGSNSLANGSLGGGGAGGTGLGGLSALFPSMGDGSASSSATAGGNNNTVERAAKELMAQGTAFTSKLKSVFQW